MKIELLDPINVLSMSFHGNAIVPRRCSMVVTFIKKGYIMKLPFPLNPNPSKLMDFTNGIVL